MWARNLLFIALCLVGMAAVAGTLLRGPRLEPSDGLHWSRQTEADIQKVVAQVNAQFQAYWGELDLAVAPRASDLALARRLSLGLMGTIPALEEIRALEAVPREHRLSWWIARVLQDRRSADYLAERLARAYVGTENGPFLVYRRRRFVTWLSDQLLKNRPYNEIAELLISDSGLWTSNPAVNFLTVTLEENNDGKPDEIRLAGRTARAFLGMRIDCLQCHDDRLGNVQLGTSERPRDGLQSDFHQLAAFYSQAELSPLGIGDGQRPYEYKYLNAEIAEVIDPRPPFLAELLPAGGETRRRQLASWVTHPGNKPFARAIVNRIWALLCGRPLVEPIDNIPLYGEFPPGLDTLAEDFVQHGYDLQRLIRVIAASDAFQRQSRASFEVTHRHEQHWSVFPLTRLRPEQVAGGLLQACSLKTIDAKSHILFQLQRYFQQSEFVQRYGDTGEDEFEDRGVTIPQRLLLMNGQLLKERTQEGLFSAASRIAQLAPNDETAVETAYLAVLTRRPTDKEKQYFVARLGNCRDNQRTQCLEDLYWVLLNSSEYSWNH